MTIENKWIEYDDFYVMIINSPTYGIFHIQIDKEDYEKVSKYHWCISKSKRKYENTEPKFYAMSNLVGLLHRYIMDAPRGKVVDHKDRNPNNNRRSNLRICGQDINAKNHKNYSTNTSGVTGVRLNTDKSGLQRWVAYIYKDYHYKSLGRFDSKEEAIKARLDAENKIRLNQNIDIKSL